MIKENYVVEYSENQPPLICKAIYKVERGTVLINTENAKMMFTITPALIVTDSSIEEYPFLKNACVTIDYTTPKDFIDYEKMGKLSYGDSDVLLSNKVIKLSEESGELSQAYLKFAGCKNVSASAGDGRLGILEESCDVINVTIDIINSLGYTSEEVKAMFDKKLSKWESKQEKYKI